MSDEIKYAELQVHEEHSAGRFQVIVDNAPDHTWMTLEFLQRSMTNVVRVNRSLISVAGVVYKVIGWDADKAALQLQRLVDDPALTTRTYNRRP